MKKATKQLRWVRLDNAAKIYPAARRKNWSNVFRQSATLVDAVDTDVLKSALNVFSGGKFSDDITAIAFDL